MIVFTVYIGLIQDQTKLTSFVKPVDIDITIERFEDRFRILQNELRRQLIDSKTDTSTLLNCLTLLPIKLKKEYEMQIKELLPSCSNEQRVDRLFFHLNPLLSFIDYGLLEYIVKLFGNDGLIADMKAYSGDMQIFMKETTIKQLIDHLPGQADVPPKFSLIKAKIGKNASECTLEQLNTIRKRYCSEVKLSEIVSHLVAVVESNSFIVRWLVPSILAYDVMKYTRNIDQSFYQECKIMSFTLDGMWLYVSETEIDVIWSQVQVSDTKFKDHFHNRIYEQILFELKMQRISEHKLSTVLMNYEPQLPDYNFHLSLVGFKTLDIIIKNFGSDCLKRVMSSYSEYVKLICSRQSTVQQLIALSPMLPKPSEYFVIAECRMDKPMEFDKLLSFQTRFCNIFNISRVCFVMSEMSTEINDSFIVSWLVPSAISVRIVKSPNNAEQDLYWPHGITLFTVDMMWLYLNEAEIGKVWSQVHVSNTRFTAQFHAMYKQIVCELVIGEISDQGLSLYLMEQQPKLQKQLCDHLSEAILNCECPSSIIDFRVLTIIIERFGSDYLKRVMRSYCKYMSTFTKQSTVQQFIDLPPVQSKPSRYFITAKCKIKEEPSGCRLERLLCLQSEFCRILDIDEVCFVMNEINTEMSGSFTVSWLVPSPLISNIMKSASNIPYQKYKIVSFTLDSMWLYTSESEISALWSVSNAKFKDQFCTIYKQILCKLEREEILEHNLSLYLMNKAPKVDSNVSHHISKAFLEQKLSLSLGIHNIIIERFGSDCLKRVMKSFCKQSTVQQLLDLLVVQFEPSKDFTTAKCRIMEEPSHYRLEELLCFQARFCTIVNVSNVCFVMVKISEETSGSFIVNWLIPSSLAFDMLKSANQIKETELFQKFNIDSLQLGSGWLYHHQLTPFGANLKERYQQSQGLLSPVEWIPSPTKKIFRLAMIQRERVQRGHIEDKFVQMTISGRIDDILHAKSPVELEHIFTDTSHGGEIILIEGAPESGKSTLTTHICQRWGKGELFQEFTVVILVQLRDPAVQRAQTIADLLPVENVAVAQELAAELIATNGRGVLWVLDGWDKLPPHLQQDSIFCKVLQAKPHKQKLAELEQDPGYSEYVGSGYSKVELLRNQYCKDRLLSEASVIVTSRPISSGDLHPVVSSRIEVLGFTPEEQKQYFTECLEGDTKTLEALLEKNPVIQSTCYLPLNAAFIVHTFKYRAQSLPNTEYEIYLSVILSCIQRHFEREGRDDDLPKELVSLDDLSRSEVVREPFQRLCELAYHGVMENKVTFSSSDLPQGSNVLSLLQAIESFLQSGKSVFYNFLHLSIQEVLSAYYIATQLSNSEQVSQFQQLFNQPRFASVFQFYSAITKLKTPGVRQVINRIVQEKSKPLLVSLLRCLHEAQDPSLCHYVAEQLNLEVIDKMQYARLDLSNNSLSPLDCHSLSFFLSSAGMAVKVNLFNCSVGDLNAKNLAKYLDGSVDHGSKATIILLVSDNNIHKEGASHIARIVNFIEHLYLCRNPIGDTGASLISKAVGENTTLKTLNLRECGIKSGGASYIAMILYFIEHLYLSLNPIGDTGASLISETVRETATLKTLILWSCGITSRGAEDLSRALAKNGSLEKVDIGGNNLGDEGISHLAETLKQNHQLKELWIGDCKMTDKGTASLASALSVNKSLKMLCIGGGKEALTEGGLSTIFQSLVSNLEFMELAIPYDFHSTAGCLSQEVNKARKRSGLPPIEIKGELCVGCMGMAYLFM